MGGALLYSLVAVVLFVAVWWGRVRVCVAVRAVLPGGAGGRKSNPGSTRRRFGSSAKHARGRGCVRWPGRRRCTGRCAPARVNSRKAEQVKPWLRRTLYVAGISLLFAVTVALVVYVLRGVPQPGP